jgi:hypothetical protein
LLRDVAVVAALDQLSLPIRPGRNDLYGSASGP